MSSKTKQTVPVTLSQQVYSSKTNYEIPTHTQHFPNSTNDNIQASRLENVTISIGPPEYSCSSRLLFWLQLRVIHKFASDNFVLFFVVVLVLSITTGHTPRQTTLTESRQHRMTEETFTQDVFFAFKNS